MSQDRTFTDTEAAPQAAAPSQPERPAEAEAWEWATEHGAPQQASLPQLLSWLARGELPPHTLVWRPGWGEWLPAMQVAELAGAFPSVTPGSRRMAQVAHGHAETPPPVPVAQYPRLRLLAKDVMGQAPPAPSTTGVFQSIAPAPAGRRVLRDLDSVQQDLVTSQVPVAKMLEAARAMKRQGYAPSWGALSDARATLLPPAPGQLSRPSDPPAASLPPATLSPLASELGLPALNDPDAAFNPLRPRRRLGPWLAFGGLAGAAITVLSLEQRLTEQASPAPPAAAPVAAVVETAVAPLVPAVSRAVTGPCWLASDSVQLDERALRDVPLVVSSLPGGVKLPGASPSNSLTLAPGWVAVGYAQNRETAVGLALSSESLELERLGTRRAVRPLFSVSPFVRDGALELQTEREGASVAYARTLDASPPLRIGFDGQGFVAGSLQDTAKRLWELPPGSVSSVPAIATHPGGLTLAALIGRKQGSLRLGVLSPGGEPLSKLESIGGADARFGRPSLASGGGTTALAVAMRSRDGTQQAIWLARASAGEVPLVLQPFEPGPKEPMGGGASADLDTPAIAALPGGGFALLYTQGPGWKRRVRLQRLSSTLSPLEAPIDVAVPDKTSWGASVGGLYWINERLLAFHFVGRGSGSSYSLWVSGLECQLG